MRIIGGAGVVLRGLVLGAALLSSVAVSGALAQNAQGGDAAASKAPMITTRVEEMPPQMRRAYALGIQEELDARGYYVGPVDGTIGKRTKGAIRQYQRDAGLKVDGTATKELLDHLKFALPKVYPRGSSAESTRLVIEIQTELQQRGYYQGAVDGMTGPMTRAAVEQFEMDAGLPPTGNIGSGLLNELKTADPSIRRN